MVSASDRNCLEPIEKASLDELRSLQLARLRDTLAHAYEDPATALARHIKGNIGISADVVVTEPGAVPRSTGKAQRVVPAG